MRALAEGSQVIAEGSQPTASIARNGTHQITGCLRGSSDLAKGLESSLMGKVLQQAVAEVAKLPESEQEEVGAWILAELESERRWDELFARSADVLADMAAEAIREDEAGLTQPLDPEAL